MKMTPDEKRAELKRMMSEYSVNAADVAEILDRSCQTIHNWRSPSSRTVPPANELRLLKFELEARKAQKEKTPVAANN